MKTPSDFLDALPELPVALFEVSGKLGFSEHAPVIVNKPEVIKVKPPVIATPHVPNRASHDLRTYHAWVLYPRVVCTPFSEPEAVAALRLEPRTPSSPSHAGDLAAIANVRHFYKLSRLHGQDLATPWGCEVRFGPWFGTIICTQSCDDQLPDQWELSSSVLAMKIEWEGTADGMPSVPNLTVVWDPNQVAHVTSECCPGFSWCQSTQFCLSNTIDCPDL